MIWVAIPVLVWLTPVPVPAAPVLPTQPPAQIVPPGPAKHLARI